MLPTYCKRVVIYGTSSGRAFDPKKDGGHPAAKAALRRMESRGLGDTIAKITSAVGIKPCGGCKKRQAALNRMVPYKRAEASSGLVEAETRAGTRPPPPLP